METMEIDSNNNEEMVKTDELINKSLAGNDNKQNEEKLTLETLDLESFLMILDHLDSNALMELCEVNEQLRSNVLLYKHILSSKLFDIAEFVDLRPIFANYGRFVRKLDVNEYNILHGKFSSKFNRLLGTIVTHLVPGNLTELTLRFGVVKINTDLLNSALPYFSNLKYFAFSACGSDDYSQAQEHVLTKIIENAQQLTSLDVRYIRTAGKWFRFEHLKNLQSLTFLFVELIKFADFRQLIQSRPALRSLVFSSESVHHQHLCRLVTRYIPNLEEFEIRNSYKELPNGDDFDFSPVPRDFKDYIHDEEDEEENEDEEEEEEEEEEENDTEDAETSFEESDSETESETEESDSDIDDVRSPEFNANIDHITSWKGVYSCLNRMNHLKRTWLKSHFINCSDLYDVLKMMARKNTIEHLTIQVSTIAHDFIQKDDFLAEPFPYSFTSLKTLRLISPSTDTQPFIRHFVKSLPNLTKCVLDMEKINRLVQDTISNLVEAANGLEALALKMPSMNFDHHLYMKLMGIQYCKSKRLTSAMKPLNIYISSKPQHTKCLTELKDYYDDKIISIRVKSFMNWETDPL